MVIWCNGCSRLVEVWSFKGDVVLCSDCGSYLREGVDVSDIKDELEKMLEECVR